MTTNPTGENGMTRTPAPELSPAEAARVAAFHAAPVPPECDPERVETVARALADASSPYDPRDWGDYLRDAAAAIAADPSPAEEAVKRVEALHVPVEWHGMNDDGEIDPDIVLTPFCRGCTDPELVAAVEFGDTIDQGERVIDWPCSTVAALASPAPAPQGEKGRPVGLHSYDECGGLCPDHQRNQMRRSR